MSKKFKLGVLGLGEGRSIMSAALWSDAWELVEICDLNESISVKKELKNLRKIRKNPLYTLDYNEMLKNDDVEVIGIFTPDQLHATHIKMALEAGKDVICTKPLMVSLDEANELLEVQRENRKNCFCRSEFKIF